MPGCARAVPAHRLARLLLTENPRPLDQRPPRLTAWGPLSISATSRLRRAATGVLRKNRRAGHFSRRFSARIPTKEGAAPREGSLARPDRPRPRLSSLIDDPRSTANPTRRRPFDPPARRRNRSPVPSPSAKQTHRADSRAPNEPTGIWASGVDLADSPRRWAVAKQSHFEDLRPSNRRHEAGSPDPRPPVFETKRTGPWAGYVGLAGVSPRFETKRTGCWGACGDPDGTRSRRGTNRRIVVA